VRAAGPVAEAALVDEQSSPRPISVWRSRPRRLEYRTIRRAARETAHRLSRGLDLRDALGLGLEVLQRAPSTACEVGARGLDPVRAWLQHFDDASAEEARAVFGDFGSNAFFGYGPLHEDDSTVVRTRDDLAAGSEPLGSKDDHSP
jgi:hypothetical protein